MPNKKPSNYADMFPNLPSKPSNVLSLDPYVAELGWQCLSDTFLGPRGLGFVELRDNQRVLGIKCRTCGIVCVPPETACGRCFEKLHEWVGGKPGVLQTYTTSHYTLPIHRNQAPRIYGIVKLDGADTSFSIFWGSRCRSSSHWNEDEAAFEEESRNIMDIKYFRPVK
jgi:uncharacterized OB-fold protein